jgi:hypothetical protein
MHISRPCTRSERSLGPIGDRCTYPHSLSGSSIPSAWPSRQTRRSVASRASSAWSPWGNDHALSNATWLDPHASHSRRRLRAEERAGVGAGDQNPGPRNAPVSPRRRVQRAGFFSSRPESRRTRAPASTGRPPLPSLLSPKPGPLPDARPPQHVLASTPTRVGLHPNTCWPPPQHVLASPDRSWPLAARATDHRAFPLAISQLARARPANSPATRGHHVSLSRSGRFPHRCRPAPTRNTLKA